MIFHVIRFHDRHIKYSVYPNVTLIRDNWNDYGFCTLFRSRLHFSPEETIDLENVKILQKGLGDEGITMLPERFEKLEIEYGSLGQTLDYYKKLAEIEPSIRDDYLRSINDIAIDSDLRESFKAEPGYTKSLLRFSEANKALSEAEFLIRKSRPINSQPSFTFTTLLPGAEFPHEIVFDFSKHFAFPNRINVLVGRNGTGKTQLLANLAIALSGLGDSGDFEPIRPSISRIIAISYSSFDKFFIPKAERNRDISYQYCGLRRDNQLIDPSDLLDIISQSILGIKCEDRFNQLLDLLSLVLGSDDAYSFVEDEVNRKVIYNNLSAGQRILTFILCNVISFIEYESMILFDEPETHLHPGLLSTLVVVIQRLLKEFNSYAVLATHSPIVLQQIPSRFVHVLRRVQNVPFVDPLPIESFGENLGEIMEHALGLAEPESDYRDVLYELSTKYPYEEIIQMFNGKLSLNARLYLESVMELKESEDE